MKINEVTLDYLKEYLKVDGNEEDTILTSMLEASKTYVKDYTGLSEENLNAIDSLTIAMLTICSDMYENRIYTFTSKTVQPNMIAKSIMDMYSRNLL